MTTATIRAAKWGNSIAVRLPKDIAKLAGVNEGDVVELRATAQCIELRAARPKLNLEDLVAQITPENRYDEVDWGQDVGKEIIEW